MTSDLLQRLDKCIASLDTLQQQQNAHAVRAYARHLDRRLERVILLMPETEMLVAVGGSDALNRWMDRICSMISEDSLLRCDPRLDQSVDDLLFLLTTIDII